MPTAAARRAAEADKKRQKTTTVTKKKPSAATKKPKSSTQKAQKAPRAKSVKSGELGVDELIAARLNEREGFSNVVGEARRNNQIWIAERMKYYETGTGRYRLKVVSYFHFASRDDLESFCDKHKIPIEFPSR